MESSATLGVTVPADEPSSATRALDGRALDVLGDEVARLIVRSAGDPKTVAQLADELDLPLSTAYRKVDALESAGLLVRTNDLANGGEPARFRRTVRTVTVRLAEPPLASSE